MFLDAGVLHLKLNLSSCSGAGAVILAASYTSGQTIDVEMQILNTMQASQILNPELILVLMQMPSPSIVWHSMSLFILLVEDQPLLLKEYLPMR